MFPNAYDGVKKIYLSEILSLIAVIIGFISGIAAVVGYKATEAGAESVGLSAAFVGGGIVFVIAMIVIFVAFILSIIGVNKASIDEPCFKKAYAWIAVELIGSIAVNMTKDGSVLNLGADIIYQVAGILVTLYVIEGIISLAKRMEKTDIAAKGTKVRNTILTVYIIALIFTIVSGFMSQSETMVAVAGIIGLIGLIITIVAYVMYLKLLSKAKNMLA